MENKKTKWSQIYFAVALTTLATLVLELSLTRIFSVVFFYHFAFLAISVALFGLGAGGVFSYVVAGWKGRLFSKLGVLAMIAGVLLIAILVAILSLSAELNVRTLAFVYFISAIPFFLTGTIVSLVIAETIERVDRVYFFDLLGAAVGCLVLVPLLDLLGGPNTVIAAAVLFAFSSVLWFNLSGSASGRAVGLIVSVGLLVMLGLNARMAFIDIWYAKGRAVHDELFVKWNSFSRVGVVKMEPNLRVVIDADAATDIVNTDFEHFSPEQRHASLLEGTGVPYMLVPGAKTMIIGSGGGPDIAHALAGGSKDITAVEINPIIATTVMRGVFADYSRHLYSRPEVRVAVEDGRAFVRRSGEKYDVLQATLVDTWAATAAGAYALSESNLYTVEAFQEYLSHLTDGGLMSFTRWGFEPPRESLRLISLAMEALKRLGETEPANHVVVLRDGGKDRLAGFATTDTVIVKRKPFSPQQIDGLRAMIAPSAITPVYLPGDRAVNPFGELLLSSDPQAYQSQYHFDISPTNDNRPFFFYTVQPRDIWAFVAGGRQHKADFKVNLAVPLLFGLVAVSLVATALVMALPPLVLGTRLPRQKGVLPFLLYFLAIGVGYILIEVALIQKFILLLGHPTYALTIIIFSMLVFSSLGSYWSRKLLKGSDQRLQWAVLGIVGVVAVLAAMVVPVTTAGVGWPMWFKVLATIGLIAPAAFLMGMPFPTGLSRLKAWHEPSVRWAWSLNAAASVLGSGSSIFLALYLGLRETLLIGGLMYLCAFLLVRLTRSPLQPAR
ncbi:MAG: hypothetical protein LAQ69_35985 [Acidobacteriia bacterium]|nr:hypothetical protein [Terriglobia bacterium]